MAASSPKDPPGARAPTQVGRSLPEFRYPPVFETVLGVEFEPLKTWQIPHFGLLWDRLKEDFPESETKPPLGQSGPGPKTKVGEIVVELEVTNMPSVRCWYLEESGTRLLQVQKDRFIHNWRKVSGDEVYPRYEDAIRPAFEKEWPRFTEFLNDHGMGYPQVRRCEVTYVNHFEKGKEWESLHDLPDVLGVFSHLQAESELPSPQNVGFSANYPLPNEGGSLNVSLKQVLRHSDAKELLQFTLTAKGPPESSKTEDLLSWFDLGREWVVTSFADLTTPRMHSIWERTS